MNFPDRTTDIQFHQAAARRSREKGDYAAARSAYLKWVESERQQDISTRGLRQRELELAKQEYSDFVRTDPLYQQIRDASIVLIRNQPGILQTALYKALRQFEKASIQYAMYFADEHGGIVRTKKGNTYALSLS